MLAITTFDWVTFGIAFGGLLVALVALVWQVVTWAWTGPRVEVTSGVREIIGAGAPPETVVAVAAVNKGRMPVTITFWAMRTADQQHFFVANPTPDQPVLPYRLDAQASVTWWATASKLRFNAKSVRDGAVPIYGIVDLATGKEITSREPAQLPVEDAGGIADS